MLTRAALVIDDESQIRRVLAHALADDFREVLEAPDGDTALNLVKLRQPSLIVLDLGLPDIPGDVLCRQIRKLSIAPILVLSARHADHEKALLLDAGADDYVTKPFSMGELLARMRNALRHRAGATEDSPLFSSGGLSVDLTRRVVTVEGDEIRLSRKEYEVLRTLVKHAGKVVTHQQLLREVWGPAHINETQYLRVYVGQLRQKIERDPTQPRYIMTEAGVGYRLRQLDEINDNSA